MTNFTKKVIRIINQIPYGKVMSYGQIASSAGNNRAARQVARILHTMSKKYELPWHRIINSQGKISFKDSERYELQKLLLEAEGIVFNKHIEVDFEIFGYKPKVW